MQLIAKILPYAQIALSVVLVAAILLQRSGASLGGALGGSDESFHHTRRGLEKFVFYLSIVCGVLFALTAFLAILIKTRG